MENPSNQNSSLSPTMSSENDVPSGVEDQSVTEVAKHGVGDRGKYYDKWEKLSREEDKRIEEEDKIAKEENDRLLGIANNPKSEAEKKDKEKREALKEAKKHWDGVTADQEAKKIVIANEIDASDRNLHFEADLQSRRVLVLKDNSNCHYTLGADISMIKIFVEGCKQCILTFQCNLATSCIEVSHHSFLFSPSFHPLGVAV